MSRSGVQTQDYFFYTPPVIDFFLPIGCEESGGSEITFTGSFTVTKEMVCKFGETALEETPANAKAGSKLYGMFSASCELDPLVFSLYCFL